MSKRESRLIAIGTTAAMVLAVGALAPSAYAQNSNGASKQTQTLNVNYGMQTGDFRGGASGTLYGLGDNGSPTDSILDGARVENSSQKPPTGTQHPSGDALALEHQFFTHGGKELAVYMQDYYPTWSYNGGHRPGDERTYNLDVPVTDPQYGAYKKGGNGRWDYSEVTEIVVNKILANSENPDGYLFIPFNEPDGGNWYYTGDDASNNLFAHTFLSDWDSEYRLIQKIWNEYRTGVKKNIHGIKPHNSRARIGGPGDSTWRENRSSAFLAHAKQQNTLPAVFVWHELGKESLEYYRYHYSLYQALLKKYNLNIPVNITEYGELRDMSVPGQIIQWQSMFESTKVQAETAYWNYAGNISDNMARANNANGGWWQFKWYGDLRGQKTVKVTPPMLNEPDTLQGIAAYDSKSRKATVLYGGANDNHRDPVQDTGTNIPVNVHMTGLDKIGLGGAVDVEVRENAFTGPDGFAAAPRVVNALSNVKPSKGNLDVTTISKDRYASYQLVVTPHQSFKPVVDNTKDGRDLQVIEAENTTLSGGAQSYQKTPWGSGWSYFMTSGNGDVGNFHNGASATWNVTIPVSGTYRFVEIGGNVGFPGTNSILVDGKPQGVVHIDAELAMKDAAKWLYRGSAAKELQLTKGTHAIQLQSSSMDNTLDKFMLYQVSGPQGLDSVTYPASQARLNGTAHLDYSTRNARGFAMLGSGTIQIFAPAWQNGYEKLTVHYKARKNEHLNVEVNGKRVEGFIAGYDGLQHSAITTPFAEGINEITISGDSDVLVGSVNTVRADKSNQKGIDFEAENLPRGGGAYKVTNSSSNASNSSWVAGIGNQFVTQESGRAGMGDPTRVKVLNSDNKPDVVTSNKGTLTIPSGRVPAGSYMLAVRFSNDAFIGHHDYNPQIVDLGLQVRSGSSAGREIARGAFRYTYSDSNFMNRSMNLDSDGGALVLGNWDPAGTGRGAVSWGVAPNIDSLVFYPTIVGAVENQKDEPSVDFSDLKKAVEKTEQLDPILYTAKSFNKVSETLAKAQKVLKDKNASQADVDSALAGLQSAVRGLVLRPVTPPVPVSPSVDRSGLSDAVTKASGIDPNAYTPASAKKLSDALSAAQRVLADSNASQTEVDMAMKALQSALSSLVSCPVPGFRDVPAGAWFAPAVRFVSCKGVMTGYDRSSFGPDDRVSREQAALVLYRAAGEPTVFGRLPYRDSKRVSPWARDAVLWAYRTRLMNGYGRLNEFGPQDGLTRSQAAAVLARASGSDIRDLQVAMDWAVKHGVIHGWPDRRGLDPDGLMDRAQMAQILSNSMMKGVLKEKKQ